MIYYAFYDSRCEEYDVRCNVRGWCRNLQAIEDFLYQCPLFEEYHCSIEDVFNIITIDAKDDKEFLTICESIPAISVMTSDDILEYIYSDYYTNIFCITNEQLSMCVEGMYDSDYVYEPLQEFIAAYSDIMELSKYILDQDIQDIIKFLLRHVLRMVIFYTGEYGYNDLTDYCKSIIDIKPGNDISDIFVDTIDIVPYMRIENGVFIKDLMWDENLRNMRGQYDD